ncbi:MAG: glucoamylase family protein [Burkholderiales bacterium]
MSELTRRRLLHWGGAAALAPLAGCSSITQVVNEYARSRSPVFDTSLADAASSAAQPAEPPAIAARTALPPLFDDIERRTFDFFWSTANAANGMVPDRYPSPSPCSIAAVGFALTAYVIGADRGFVTREQARERVLTTVRFFRNAPQGPQPRGVTGHKGFFYHFLDMKTGQRAPKSELSTVDTALLIGGMLHAQSFFDGEHADEVAIRENVDQIYWRIDWKWAQVRGQLISMGWSPEKQFIPHDWNGYNEAMLVVLLALGSPTHPVEEGAWSAWTESYRGTWGRFMGYEHLSFAPLFGHQYSHVWIDFRGLQDATMRQRGIDYFENTRRAVYAQRAYAIANPNGWFEYGANVWGFTACDGPGTMRQKDRSGRTRYFLDYSARGAGRNHTVDDGTIAPTAAVSSLPFAPEIVIPAVAEMHARYGFYIFQKYGFVDSFNRSFTAADVQLTDGRVDPGFGWVANDYLGIDQGPILAMICNYRNELVWDDMRKCVPIRRGLERAGFSGGWLSKAG